MTYQPFVKINLGTGQTPGSKTITDSSTEILAANTSRAGTVIVNTGKNIAWIACDTTALVDKGIPISVGGSLPMDSAFISRGAVNAICRTGKTTTFSFQDFNEA